MVGSVEKKHERLGLTGEEGGHGEGETERPVQLIKACRLAVAHRDD
jgi:hypothetical protein